MHAVESPPKIESTALNHFLRRLRQYRGEGEWVSTLLDGVSQFVEQAAVFAIEGGELRLRGKSNLDIAEDLAFPISSAGAFQAAIDSKDPVVTLRTAGEVTKILSTPNPNERAHIVPIVNGPRVVAVLFAARHDQDVDVNALELIVGMASIVLERQSNVSLHSQIATPLSRSEQPPRELNLGAGYSG